MTFDRTDADRSDSPLDPGRLDPGPLDPGPSPLEPIDPEAPVSGHHVPASGPRASTFPEHDWGAARGVVYPGLRAAGTGGLRLAEIEPERMAAESRRDHAEPVIDDGPAGLVIVYTLGLGDYDVLVSADHLLAWGIGPDDLRAAAMANLAAWSRQAPWVEEVDGGRRIRSSDTGDGFDAARILLPDVRQELVRTLALAPGSKVVVVLPESNLLVAAGVAPGDAEFAAQLAAFGSTAASEADHPIAAQPLELTPEGLRQLDA
jgi:hypothetical protein